MSAFTNALVGQNMKVLAAHRHSTAGGRVVAANAKCEHRWLLTGPGIYAVPGLQQRFWVTWQFEHGLPKSDFVWLNVPTALSENDF